MAYPFSSTKNWINLSSADRTSGNSNDFTIQFNSGGITNDSGGYFGSKSYINPIFFSFPNNAFNIQDNFNNVFYISGSKFNASNVGTYKALELTAGLYQNVSQLTSQLTTIINGYIKSSDPAVLGANTYTGNVNLSQILDPVNLSYNKILFTFANPAAGETINLYFSQGTPISFVNINNQNFGGVIGTDENVFTLTVDEPLHTLPYLPNLNIYDIIQIKCNLTRSTYELELKQGSTRNGVLSPSLIMVAFPSANFVVNDNILFTNNNPLLYRQVMNTPNYDSIQIQICDKNGRLIPFFGEVDFSITIEREVFTEPVNLTRSKDQNPYTAPMFYQ